MLLYDHCCYNKLRVVGKALEVSHKSGGKSRRAAGAGLYIINKDVEEVQAAGCCGYCYSGLAPQQS